MNPKPRTKAVKKVTALLIAFVMLSLCIFADIAPLAQLAPSANALNTVNMRGDVNFDGRVSSADAFYVFAASVNIIELSADQEMVGDTDDDGIITANDARLVLRTAVGLEEIIYIDTDISVNNDSDFVENAEHNDFDISFEQDYDNNKLLVNFTLRDLAVFADLKINYSSRILSPVTNSDNAPKISCNDRAALNILANESTDGEINLSMFKNIMVDLNNITFTLTFDILQAGTASVSLSGETYFIDMTFKKCNTSNACEVRPADEIVSISYTPATPYVFDEYVSADRDGYYNAYISEGDILTLTYPGGRTKDFVFTISPEYHQEFVGSDGEIIHYYEVDIDSEQYPDKWTAGEHYFTVTYDDYSCRVPATINECPIKEISASFRYPLYLGYNCNVGQWLSSNRGFDGPDYSAVITPENIDCTIEYKNGEKITTTFDKLNTLFDAIPSWSIEIMDAGANEGIFSLGTFTGDFTVTVEDSESVINTLPEYSVYAECIYVKSGEKLDIQLIDFADKGYSRELEIMYIPEGLTLDNNGRLTGTVGNIDDMPYYYDYLGVRIKWEGTYISPYVDIRFAKKGDSVQTIPDSVQELHIDELVNVTATEESPRWFSFRATQTGVWISEGEHPTCSVYDKNGEEIPAEGYGDGAHGVGGRFCLIKGEKYYIKAVRDGIIFVNSSWMPKWNNPDSTPSEPTLIKTNEKKTFKGDTNEYWNVYSLTGTVEKDFSGFGYWVYGSMDRYISPVNIHFELVEFKTNYSVIDRQSYKYDPNNEDECRGIGASTTQQTLINKLGENEKEYRFDNVFYFMPQTGRFTIEELRYIYVPVGYCIVEGRVVKHEKEQHTDEDFDGRCDVCGELTGVKPVITGDVDGDSTISASDARYALRASVGLEKYEPGTPEFKAADVDKDGDITSSDARLILRASVGLEAL